MDGLLIDSEDLYTIVTNAILQKYGRPLLPWSIKAQMQGRPQPEVRPTLYIVMYGILTKYLGRQDLQRLCPAPHRRAAAERGANSPSGTLLPTRKAAPRCADSVVQSCVDAVNR